MALIGQTPEHEGRQNCNRSLKAMEGDIAVQLHLSKQVGKNCITKMLLSKRIHHESNKFTINMMLTNQSIPTSATSRGQYTASLKRYKEIINLTATVHQDFTKKITYAVHQNKGKHITDIERALRNTIPHMFGEHDKCGNWCGYKKEENYRHSGLPNSNARTDKDLGRSYMR